MNVYIIIYKDGNGWYMEYIIIVKFIECVLFIKDLRIISIDFYSYFMR